MIKINDLSKNFGKRKVLNHINLEFDRGKIYGVVGKNGAGKTTLFRCLAGLESHDGSIVSQFDNLKNHVGILETNPMFMARITGWEYLKLLCTARNIKADNFEGKNIFDLPLDEYAATYSTGMKKKLALLGVILQKNEVFVLDEPFNGVDIQSNMIITELLNELRKQNKTIIISSHIFSILSDMCNEILHIENGRINKSISPDAYHALESEMKQDIIGSRISNLDL